jgi:hypothetical protein
MDEDPLLAHGIPVIMNLVPHFTNSTAKRSILAIVFAPL